MLTPPRKPEKPHRSRGRPRGARIRREGGAWRAALSSSVGVPTARAPSSRPPLAPPGFARRARRCGELSLPVIEVLLGHRQAAHGHRCQKQPRISMASLRPTNATSGTPGRFPPIAAVAGKAHLAQHGGARAPPASCRAACCPASICEWPPTQPRNRSGSSSISAREIQCPLAFCRVFVGSRRQDLLPRLDCAISHAVGSIARIALRNRLFRFLCWLFHGRYYSACAFPLAEP